MVCPLFSLKSCIRALALAIDGSQANFVRLIGNIELFVNEMLRRRDVLAGTNRKRKASVSGPSF